MPANARMTELEALNLILRQAGEQPVKALTPLPRSAQNAYAVLQDITKEIQEDASFWNWNTEKNQELLPDATTKKIQVATNVVSISRAKDCKDYTQELTLRGEYIYDISQSTDQFTASVIVDLRVMLEWDEIPVQHRRYIAIRSAREYQISFIASEKKHRYDMQKEYEARGVALGVEAKEAGLSMLQNPQIAHYNNRRF